MAKGQKRSNREPKKPKQQKAKTPAAASAIHAAMEAGGAKKGPKR